MDHIRHYITDLYCGASGLGLVSQSSVALFQKKIYFRKRKSECNVFQNRQAMSKALVITEQLIKIAKLQVYLSTSSPRRIEAQAQLQS